MTAHTIVRRANAEHTDGSGRNESYEQMYVLMGVTRVGHGISVGA